MLYQGEKYFCTNETARETLDKYGVAIIPNVLTQKEIQKGREGMWDTLETLTSKFETPVKRDNEKTWCQMKKLLPTKGMLIQHHGIGHAPFIWDIRQNEEVVDIFSHMWATEQEDLLCSFDGAGILLPHEVTGFGSFRNGTEWYHLDQSPSPGRSDFECVQGWVTLYDVNEGDATLTVFEKSHKYHKKFAKKTGNTDKKDWFLLKKEQGHYDFYLKENKCKKVCIVCPAGSMVLWDSRTVHAGMPSLKNRDEPNFRCVVYICMVPRELAINEKAKNPEALLEKKQKAFKERRMTSHWPHKVKLFSKNAGNRWAKVEEEITELPSPKLEYIGKRLAGF